MHTRDARLRNIARDQHGVFTLEQALVAGFTRPVVRRRLEGAIWEVVTGRVYRAASSGPLTWREQLMAAALATGGVALGRAAGALHGLVQPPSRPEVTVGRRSRRGVEAVVHTSTDLLAVDLSVVDGIPATAVARTLIDLGGCLSRAVFEDVLDTALVKGVVSFDRLRRRAEALWAPRRRGCALVLELLTERDPEITRAANLWEVKVLRVVRRLGLPQPRVNYRVKVGGRNRVLDLAWPEAKVAVEFDGFVPHSTRSVFDDDRARQNDLVADGWTVFRVTKPMLANDVERTFAPIAAAIAGKARASGTRASQNVQLWQ